MNECCDWHGVCLNDKEMVENNHTVYISYCPECNSLAQCENNIVTQIDGDKKDSLMEKYQDKVNVIKANK